MGISFWQLLIILVIVLLLFGTKRLKNLGGDLGGAIKGFKKAMNEDDAEKAENKNLEKPVDAQRVDAQRVDASRESSEKEGGGPRKD